MTLKGTRTMSTLPNAECQDAECQCPFPGLTEADMMELPRTPEQRIVDRCLAEQRAADIDMDSLLEGLRGYTPEAIRERIETVNGEGDPETAASMRDNVTQKALRAIAAGHSHPQRVASDVLRIADVHIGWH